MTCLYWSITSFPSLKFQVGAALQANSDIQPDYYQCDILGFKSGSLVVYLLLDLYADSSITEEQLLQGLMAVTDPDHRLFSEDNLQSITLKLDSLTIEGMTWYSVFRHF